MIEQVIEKPETESAINRRWLTPQEIEKMTQPLYDRSLAEMKTEWKNRFEERRKDQPPK